MAAAGGLTNRAQAPRRAGHGAVTALRFAIIVTLLMAWEALAASGLLYRDVVPSLAAIGSALWRLLSVADFTWHIEIVFGPVDFVRDVTIPQSIGISTRPSPRSRSRWRSAASAGWWSVSCWEARS